jgi:hypothetical protein
VALIARLHFLPRAGQACGAYQPASRFLSVKTDVINRVFLKKMISNQSINA